MIFSVGGQDYSPRRGHDYSPTFLRWKRFKFFWWRLNIYGEAAALIVGLPLGYIVWFPLGFSELPFWQGFLFLFALVLPALGLSSGLFVHRWRRKGVFRGL